MICGKFYATRFENDTARVFLKESARQLIWGESKRPKEAQLIVDQNSLTLRKTPQANLAHWHAQPLICVCLEKGTKSSDRIISVLHLQSKSKTVAKQKPVENGLPDRVGLRGHANLDDRSHCLVASGVRVTESGLCQNVQDPV